MHCTCEGLSSMRLLAGRSACLNLAHRGLLGISHAAVVILDSWPTVVVGHVMETKASVSHRSPINSYVARPLDRLPPAPARAPASVSLGSSCLPNLSPIRHHSPAILPDGCRSCWFAALPSSPRYPESAILAHGRVQPEPQHRLKRLHSGMSCMVADAVRGTSARVLFLTQSARIAELAYRDWWCTH